MSTSCEVLKFLKVFRYAFTVSYFLKQFQHPAGAYAAEGALAAALVLGE
jgi:hypothetical protein